jgi:DinB family protein
MNPAERTEMIEEYGRGFDLLTAALAEIPREAWEFKPAPQEWGVHELLVHMKDSEYMGVLRLHKLIAEPGSMLMPYQEDKWPEKLGYQNQSMEDALQLFKLMRQTTHRLLKSLPEQVFSHSVVHPEWSEPYRMENWLVIYASHVPEHVGQLQQIYRAWKEENR